MRIRQVRPEFWTDDVVGNLSDSVRLFYIGLWNVADDGGWLDWQPTQIGALLYPYRSATLRTRHIVEWGQQLEQVQRLAILDCGCAVVPTLPKHQRVTGKQSFTVRDKHKALHGKHSPLTDSPVTEGNVEEGNVGSSATPQEWRDLRAKLRAVA